MSEYSNNNSQCQSSFPRQKQSYKKKIAKEKQWFKDCVDSAEDMALSYNSTKYKRMQTMFDLDNDILDESEMEKVFNPMGLEDATFPSQSKNYPIATPKIDLLQGEELKRRFDWSARGKNLDVESDNATSASEMLMQIMMQELEKESTDEEAFNKKMDKMSKYLKYSYKSKHELTATRTLQYLWREQELQRKFNNQFRYALVAAREVYRVDAEAGEPIVEECDPRSVFPIRMGDSNKIEDADIISHITYEPVNKVIDSFYDYLTDAQVDKLEDMYSNSMSGSGSALNYDHELPAIYSNLDFADGQGFKSLSSTSEAASAQISKLPFDENGNVRVVRVRWKSRKRVGLLTFFDKSGEEDTRIVSEYYKIDEDAGETIKFIWINEACEGTKIADSEYVKLQIRDTQMRHFGNVSKCFLGYVGTVYSRSLMEKMEPYQYLYNIYMRKLELIMAKYKGPIYELDVSKVPDDWEMGKWMYYADVLGWSVVDSFNEGKKGSATGKLAGNYNQGGRVLDPNIGNYIQQVVLMLTNIEDLLGKVSGVSDQRAGQVENRETVGGVERAVTQSSHITEKWFFEHDETKKRVMAALLDTAKHAWKGNKSKKLNFVLDDMSKAFIDFNPSEFASSEFDLFITNSSRDLEIRQHLTQMSHAHLQNGGDMSTVIDVLTSESITEMRRILDDSADKMREQQQQAQKQQQETQQQIAQIQQAEQQADRKLEYDKLELERYKIDIDAQVKLEIAEKSAEPVVENDDNNDGLAEQIHNDKMNLDNRKQVEIERSNRAKETIARMKPKTTSSSK